MLTKRSVYPRLGILFAILLAAAGCDDDEPFQPINVPDVSGFWSGQYRVASCSLSGASDPFFCDEVFSHGASLILELDLFQSGTWVGGEIAQGELLGEVEGAVDGDGVLRLEGVIGGPADEFSTTILAWQTGLVGDSLLGSWRFWIEDVAGGGFGAATVDASVRLYGPSVVKFFGCAAEGALGIDGEIGGTLADPDCQLATSMFVEGLEDGAYFDVYTLTGSAGDSIEVTLRSTVVDALLLIANLDEEVLGGDDDSGGGPGGTDAAVTVVFDGDDTVLVIATSFAPGEAGGYTLGAEQLLPAPAAARASVRELNRGVRVLGGGAWKQRPDRDRAIAERSWRLRRSSSRAALPAQ